MPEIPVGRVAIGRVVTTEEMLRIIGATEERQRVRAKVEEMISDEHLRIDSFFDSKDPDRFSGGWAGFGAALLRWLDEEAP